MSHRSVQRIEVCVIRVALALAIASLFASMTAPANAAETMTCQGMAGATRPGTHSPSRNARLSPSAAAFPALHESMRDEYSVRAKALTWWAPRGFAPSAALSLTAETAVAT